MMGTILLTLKLLAVLLQAEIPQSVFDKTVHDFGTIREKDGPVSCAFTVTNTGSDPVNIFAVITTCGCTKVSWTREDIPAGCSGTVEVTYANDEGPYPFDKNLKVYISDRHKPVSIHIKGNVRK